MNRDTNIPTYIITSPSSAYSDDYEDSKVKRTGITTDEFKLHEDYHNAIEYLITCRSVIQSLQDEIVAKEEELASKDEQIEKLEEKIVEMSVELATAKAVEDEHRLLKRRLSSNSNSFDASGQTLNASLSSFNYMPARNINRRNSNADFKDSREELCQSWPGRRSSMPNPSANSEPKRRGFRLSNFRFASRNRSWGSLDASDASSAKDKALGFIVKDATKEVDEISLDPLDFDGEDGQVVGAEFLPFPTRYSHVSAGNPPSSSENDVWRQQDDASTDNDDSWDNKIKIDVRFCDKAKEVPSPSRIDTSYRSAGSKSSKSNSTARRRIETTPLRAGWRRPSVKGLMHRQNIQKTSIERRNVSSSKNMRKRYQHIHQEKEWSSPLEVQVPSPWVAL
eukprot:CAMPEP_0183708130 /NCGR_PEP_ID=MMETSP0737-20130205/4522_1 /TAXON_ID=385413 /ORGANISM="Thalassiosira miniscula, Strain CCMP1093" /LENGTH=393 /DNA_ID=CAMNT_0025935939 /DNA_START=111 /DNA_END=1292 /DNA_ORIENTATION=-